MEAAVPNQELKPLSATRTKTLDNCSWLYWCNYHLKLPQDKAEGAKKGDVCHWIFEILIHDKHRKRVQKIVKANTLYGHNGLKRLLKLYIKRAGLPNTQTIYEHVEEMVLTGLRSDFYVAGGKLVEPEFRFDITQPAFRIKGFMDKPFIKDGYIYIDDYKSSKQKFKGEDQESNMQALFYSFAARILWPDLVPVVRFIFLQYPKDPIMTVKFTDDALKGFSLYLAEIQKRVNIFNEFTAKSAFAADVEPHDGGFNGKLMCGFAKKPNQKKKDGSKMWHCPYKFAFDYFVVKKDGKIVKTYLKKEDVPALKEGETLEESHYQGCPKFRNVIEEFDTKPKPKTKYYNVLDDF